MIDNPLTKVSVVQLKRAIEIRERIEALEQELNQVLSVPSEPEISAIRGRRGKRTMSPEARARIGAAQKARWAKKRGIAAPATHGRTVGRKEAIAAILKSAGPKGATTAEMRQKLKLTTNQLMTWLYSTGKKIKQIKRLGRGRYGWVEMVPA
jgi:hypothetical protein